MLNKKDKYRLRALANPLKSVVILGKDGFDENIIKAIQDAINAQELIKVEALKTYDGLPIKELALMICNIIDAEYIFSIGRTFVIYKKNKDLNKYDVK